MRKFGWLLIIPLILVGTYLLMHPASEKKNSLPSNLLSGASSGKPDAKSPAAIVATTPTPTHRVPAQSGETSPLLAYLMKKDPKNEWTIQSHPDGRPSHILGGRLKSSSLQGLLKEVAPYLGVRQTDLRFVREEEGGSISNSSQLNQYYGRYRVYGSNIKAFSNPQTMETYHIVSDLRPLEEVDVRQSISREEAGEIARKAFGDVIINSIKVSNDPVVYGTTPNDNQLVWRVQILSEKPRYQSREMLIGAHSGAVVVDKSMLKH